MFIKVNVIIGKYWTYCIEHVELLYPNPKLYKNTSYMYTCTHLNSQLLTESYLGRFMRMTCGNYLFKKTSLI